MCRVSGKQVRLSATSNTELEEALNRVLCESGPLGPCGWQPEEGESHLPVAEILLSRDSWRCCCSITCLKSNQSRHLELSVPVLPRLKAGSVVLLRATTLGSVCVEAKGLLFFFFFLEKGCLSLI